MPTQPDPLQRAVHSLQAGLWKDYVANIKNAYGEREDEIWLLLAKEHPTRVDLIRSLSRLSGQDSITACRWLLPAICHLSAISLEDAKELLNFAETLDLAHRYALAQQLSPHIAARPGLGRELGAYLRECPTSVDAAAYAWAGAFAAGAPKAAAAYLEDLLNARGTRLAAILCTFLPAEEKEVKSILLSLEPLLAEAIARDAATLGASAWAALCNISGQSICAKSSLLRTMRAGLSVAIVEIANSLYRAEANAIGVTGQPLEDLVNELLQIALTNENVRPSIDAAVHGLFFKTSLCPLATNAVASLGQVDDDVVRLFPEVFGGLASKHSEFASVLSDWLLRTRVSLRSLGSLLSKCANGRVPARLDEAAFAAQTPGRRTKAALRLLALTHNGPTLCEFCGLIAQMSSLGTEGLNLSGEMLNEAFSEYPAATEEFLKEKTSITTLSSRELELFQGIYANVLEWRGVLERLPRRNELIPNDSELQALRARKRRVNREVMRMAAEQSIFAGLFAQLHLAQGRKFASHTPFGEPQITEMAESSHFVELPSSERADPMRGEIKRRNFLRSAR